MPILAIVLLTLGWGCRQRNAEERQLRTIKVAMDLWPGYYPLFLADELGYFAREDVEVIVELPQDTQRMKSDFMAKRYDAVFISLGDVLLMTRSDPAIRWVLSADESRGADQILGDASMQDPAELRGKTVSTALGGFGELFVRRFLNSQGLTPDDVTIANADAADVPRLLRDRTVAAGHTWEPYARAARDEGALVLFSSDQAPGLIVDGMVAHTSSLNPKKDAFVGFTKAWFEAMDYWKKNPEEADRILKKRLERIPGGRGEISLHGIHLLDRAANRKLLGAEGTATLAPTLHEYIEFFLSRGTLAQPLQPEQVLDARLVE